MCKTAKSALFASVALFGTLAASGSASAMELWDPHLRGADEGLASGAALPPGVYGIMNNYWAAYSSYDSKGHKTGTKLDALVEVPMVIWQTGYKVLGGDLAMAVAQAFDYTNLKVPGSSDTSANGHWGTYNTIFVPVQLSWALPQNLHVTTNLTVYADNATSSPGDPPGGGGIGSGNGYWTLEPNLAASWIKDGWNVSLSMHYDFNFKNHETDYHSGQQIAIDYTVAKTVGKWTFGLGGYMEKQVTDDSGSGAVAAGCDTSNGCRASNYGMGPVIGYQFADMALHFTYNHVIHAENDVAGSIFNLRLVTAF